MLWTKGLVMSELGEGVMTVYGDINARPQYWGTL